MIALLVAMIGLLLFALSYFAVYHVAKMFSVNLHSIPDRVSSSNVIDRAVELERDSRRYRNILIDQLIRDGDKRNR